MFHARRRLLSLLRVGIAVLVLGVITSFVIGCSKQVEEEKIVKIGVLAPLTGPSAADGEEFVRGAQLAVKEINAAGGVKGYKFEVVVGDTRDQVADAVLSAVKKLISDDKVGIILTGYASTTNFEIEQMAEVNMPYLLAGNAVQFEEIVAKNPEGYPTVWNCVPSYDQYETELPKIVESLAKEGKVHLRNRKLAMITSDNPYSKSISEGLVENFTAIGWTVTLNEMVPFQDIQDWRAILAKIRSDPPDLIVNTDYLPANEATFMHQFLEDPTPSLIFMQYGPQIPEFFELTKEKSTGVLYNGFGMIRSPKWPRTQEIIDKYKAEYGVEVGSYGASLYYMVRIYAEALEKIGDPWDRLAIGKALGETDMLTHGGRWRFDPSTHLLQSGENLASILFYQLWEGKRVLFYPSQYSTGEFQLPPWIE